ncbi:MAG: DUF5686 family protein [Bacteroidales bacterium]
MKKQIIYIILILFWFCCPAWGQTRLIEGIIKDSLTQQPLGYVSVYLKGTTHGAMTDDNGIFRLDASGRQVLVVSCIGYKEYTAPVSSFKNNPITILLAPSQYQLAEVQVKPKKEKYKKKGNPAVEFVRRIIDNRKAGDPHSKDYYSFQRYEKLTYALNDFDSIQQQKWLYRKFGFLKNYVDTSEISHKPILTVSTKEMIENNYFRKDPESTKKVIEAYKHDGLDEMLPEESINALFGEAFKEIDIFQNDISLFFNRFVSPLSSMGPNFYKYYLLDTLMIDGVKCQDLGFVPMVSESFGFTGHLYVALDSTYFVKKAQLNVPHDINLNFVDKMSIVQEYERTPENIRLIQKDDIAIEFKLVDQTRGIYARRTNTYRKHRFEAPDPAIFKQEAPVITLDEARFREEDYWKDNRHIAIREKENAVQKLLINLREVPLFYYSEKFISMIVGGYIPTAAEKSKVDIGPINTMISGNSFEGARFRIGGITSAYLNKNWFGSGYVAYGTRDEEFKYKAQLEYSFIDKKEHANEFPIHSIRASYMYDIDQLGQQYLFTNKDNIVLSLKRKSDDRVTYLRKAEISYQREHYSGLSYNINLRNKTEYATNCVQFNQLLPDGSLRMLNKYQMTEAEFKIRYAPREKFYQMKTRRIPITPETPVFYASHITAKKGWLGSDYTYNRTEVGFEKRFWLSAFGYIQTYVNAGKIWDAVPFPMLSLPNANLSYTIQPQSYSLMNAVEFINDEYASWDVTYFMNGWLFNRVPLLKFLKWREVISFRGLFGNLSDKNLPQNNSSLFIFPEGSYKMGKTPYMEASVGIENIFKLMRLDYVWRLSYRNHPNIDTRGIRVSMHVTF